MSEENSAFRIIAHTGTKQWPAFSSHTIESTLTMSEQGGEILAISLSEASCLLYCTDFSWNKFKLAEYLFFLQVLRGKWKSRIRENPDAKTETETNPEVDTLTESATGSDTGSVLFYFFFFFFFFFLLSIFFYLLLLFF